MSIIISDAMAAEYEEEIHLYMKDLEVSNMSAVVLWLPS